jgi:hypothetical protein
VDQHPAALDMAEEAVADTGALGGALDQAGNVRQHELALLVPDHAELRHQRGEGIIADFRASVGNLVDEGRFARIGQPDQPDVGEQLEAQPDRDFLRRDARLVLAGRAVGAGLVAGVAAPAHPAFEQHDPLADLGEVREQLLAFLVEHLRAHRDLDWWSRGGSNP